MKSRQPTPLQASFWLSDQEKFYLLVVCAIFLVGLTARYFYLKKQRIEANEPPAGENVTVVDLSEQGEG